MGLQLVQNPNSQSPADPSALPLSCSSALKSTPADLQNHRVFFYMKSPSLRMNQRGDADDTAIGGVSWGPVPRTRMRRQTNLAIIPG